MLAERFGRTPEWVIANLGEANDLALIHRHLAERLQDKSTQEVDRKSTRLNSRHYS